MSCNEHKRYKGKKEPTVPCIACWTLYMANLMEYGDTNQNIAAKLLKKARKKAGLTRAELALEANLTADHIRKVELAMCGLGPGTTERVLDVLKIYGDERITMTYYLTAKYRRKSITKIHISSDLGQALVRQIMEKYTEVLRRYDKEPINGDG